MEEDIKVLEERINFCKNNKECREELKQCFGCTFEVEEIQAIENLIKGYKELEEKMKKQLQVLFNYEDKLEYYENNILEELDSYIKLDKISKLNEIGIKGIKYIKKDKIELDYIPKSKVIELIKQLEIIQEEEPDAYLVILYLQKLLEGDK